MKTCRIHDTAMRGTLALLAAVLAACSSPTGSTERGEFGPTYQERLAATERALFKGDTSQRSPFEKHVQRMQADRSFSTSSFHTRSYQGGGRFSGADDTFKAGSFAQSDKTSAAGARTFSGADDQSRLGGSTFSTSQSRLGGKTSSSAGKTSPLADDTFKTEGNPAVLKAASNIKVPLIQDLGPPSYTEDEVRRILQKD